MDKIQNKRYPVLQKKITSLVATTVVYNLIVVALLVFIIIFSEKEKAIYWLGSSMAFLIVTNIFLFSFYNSDLCYVQFEKKMVKCNLRKKTKKGIFYQDVKEYGIVWYKGVQFIYISKIRLTDSERYSFIYDLCRNKKDVIAFMYQEEALQILKEKMMAQNNHATYYEV